MNGIHVLVLFNSGATRSIVSFALSKRFVDVPREFDYLLDVDIVDDHSVRVTMVHRGCTLELFNEQYPIDLVYILMQENKVIVQMDWLSPNGVIIDCGLQLVRFLIYFN